MPLDISIKSNRKHHRQFYIVNLTKTWLGNFSGDFSLSLGDFLTETSGHPGDHRLVNHAQLNFMEDQMASRVPQEIDDSLAV